MPNLRTANPLPLVLCLLAFCFQLHSELGRIKSGLVFSHKATEAHGDWEQKEGCYPWRRRVEQPKPVNLSGDSPDPQVCQVMMCPHLPTLCWFWTATEELVWVRGQKFAALQHFVQDDFLSICFSIKLMVPKLTDFFTESSKAAYNFNHLHLFWQCMGWTNITILTGMISK